MLPLMLFGPISLASLLETVFSLLSLLHLPKGTFGPDFLCGQLQGSLRQLGSASASLFNPQTLGEESPKCRC